MSLTLGLSSELALSGLPARSSAPIRSFWLGGACWKWLQLGKEHVKIDHHMRHSTPLEQTACLVVAAIAHRGSFSRIGTRAYCARASLTPRHPPPLRNQALLCPSQRIRVDHSRSQTVGFTKLPLSHSDSGATRSTLQQNISSSSLLTHPLQLLYQLSIVPRGISVEA